MSQLTPERCVACCNTLDTYHIIDGVACCKSCYDKVRRSEADIEIISNFWMSKNAHRSWDYYFMGISSMVAAKSKDPSTKVGAVIAKDKTIISTGYNGLPRGCNDALKERYERPLKYKWITHAEENAILNGHRNGLSMVGATIYVGPLYPCSKCTGAIIQSGIKRVVCKSTMPGQKWIDEFEISKQMMLESNVEYIELC